MPNEDEPIEQFHGSGAQALLAQADYLEAHLFDRHILTAQDPWGRVRQIGLETPEEVMFMVDQLRESAKKWQRAHEQN